MKITVELEPSEVRLAPSVERFLEALVDRLTGTPATPDRPSDAEARARRRRERDREYHRRKRAASPASPDCRPTSRDIGRGSSSSSGSPSFLLYQASQEAGSPDQDSGKSEMLRSNFPAENEEKTAPRENSTPRDVAPCRATSADIADATALEVMEAEPAAAANPPAFTLSGEPDKPPAKPRPKHPRGRVEVTAPDFDARFPGFGRFWRLYPIKKARMKCRELWLAESLEHDAPAIVAAVEQHLLEDHEWRRGFAPHPSTFLGQRRWEGDEPVQAPRPTPSPLTHSERIAIRKRDTAQRYGMDPNEYARDPIEQRLREDALLEDAYATGSGPVIDVTPSSTRH